MQKGNTLSLHQFKNSDCLLAGGLKILEEGDGIIDMGINSSALEWVADFILLLGKNATVLEPVELLDIMKRKYMNCISITLMWKIARNDSNSIGGSL